jgi:cation diffusion facilitator family transporter
MSLAAAHTHDHVFLGADHDRNARRTFWVILLTAAMMVAEIAAGAAFGSLALLADGFHMATHAGALAIAAGAYLYARRHAHDPRYSFGTGKVGELAGFASAVILGGVALLIAYECVLRLFQPAPIRFDEAIAVAVLGLVVNIVSVFLLHDSGGQHGHEHHDHAAHDHHGDHDHHHHHGHDSNLRAAYFHVLADALTSVLAIVGLLAGRSLGWLWMDPLVGLVGAVVIARWSWLLIRQSSAVLLDTIPDTDAAAKVRAAVESAGDIITDLHIWRLGPGHAGLIVSLVTASDRDANWYKQRLAGIAGLSHVTVEVVRG